MIVAGYYPAGFEHLDSRDRHVDRIDGAAIMAHSVAHLGDREIWPRWPDDIDRTYYLDTQGGE